MTNGSLDNAYYAYEVSVDPWAVVAYVGINLVIGGFVWCWFVKGKPSTPDKT